MRLRGLLCKSASALSPSSPEANHYRHRFLGSDEASYVNGQAWAVDGGLSAGHPHVPGKLA